MVQAKPPSLWRGVYWGGDYNSQRAPGRVEEGRWPNTWPPSSAPRKTNEWGEGGKDRGLSARRQVFPPPQQTHLQPDHRAAEPVSEPPRTRPSRQTARTEVFTELEEKYGEIEEMNVCDNLGDHLVGNVYVKFRREEDAERAVGELNNRWFNGQAVRAELSPVTDFRESCCRQYEMGECTRGGFCNFMHLRPISRELRRQLYGQSQRGRAPSFSRSHNRPRGKKRQSSPDHRYGCF
ncbi:splicing factor U2AF 26 kDa subunit [Emys orbicularis]|uniref:splicing factor U2AF 26 kDa subunit n=1 Tax=Emys orbicularis TaxID=82168 RepID=UPI0031FBAB9C